MSSYYAWSHTEIQEGNDRLEILANALAKHPDEKFDLAEWDCGTTCCAVGLACRLPEFNKVGLQLFVGEPFYKDPAGTGHRGWVATRQFFRITKAEADYLFNRSSYRNPMKSEVIYRLRMFVNLRPTNC